MQDPIVQILGPTPCLRGVSRPLTEERLRALAYLAWHLNEDVSREELAEAIISKAELRGFGGVDQWLRKRKNQIESFVSDSRVQLASSPAANVGLRIPQSRRYSGVYTMTGPRESVDILALLDAKAATFEHLASQRFEKGLQVAEEALTQWRGPLKLSVFNTASLQELDGLTKRAYRDLLANYARCSTPEGRRDVAYAELETRSERDPWLKDELEFQTALAEVIPGPTRRTSARAATHPPVALSQSMYTSLESRFGAKALRRSQQVLDEILSTSPSAPEFRFFTLSGISAAGKDSLVRRARRIADYENAVSFSVMTKLTTRNRREFEEDYSQSVTAEEFISSLECGDLIFPYEKRGSLYAFRTHDLRTCMANGRKLLAVFTQIELVPKVYGAFKAHGLSMIPVFIRANSNSAMQRTEGRNFSLDEQAARRDSITLDLESIEARGSQFVGEYIFIDHTNDNAQNYALEQLLMVIRGTHPDIEKFVTEENAHG